MANMPHAATAPAEMDQNSRQFMVGWTIVGEEEREGGNGMNDRMWKGERMGAHDQHAPVPNKCDEEVL
jgi:hypothetical protein